MASENQKIIEKRLTDLEAERARVLDQLRNAPRMMRGSYARVYTKCGKKNCHCQKGQGHPHSRITWSENGKGRTRKIPVDQIESVSELTRNYRAFKATRKELADLESRERELLDQLEKELIDMNVEDIHSKRMKVVRSSRRGNASK